MSRAYEIRGNPYKALWARVLWTGLQDACGKPVKACGGASVSLPTHQARAWIATKDFDTVCELAGMEPDFVRDAYRAGKLTKESLKIAGRLPQEEAT